MIRAALASALMLAAVGGMPVSAEPIQARSEQKLVLTESHIAQAKAALQLTPEQERHWPRVASALRSFSRQGGGAVAQLNGARKVIAAAGPLLRSLDPYQRQTAMSMVRSLGFGHLMSAL